jgi:hypothetical protein
MGGIYRTCVYCEQSFYCTDGDCTCSMKCSVALEEMEEEGA